MERGKKKVEKKAEKKEVDGRKRNYFYWGERGGEGRKCRKKSDDGLLNSRVFTSSE